MLAAKESKHVDHALCNLGGLMAFGFHGISRRQWPDSPLVDTCPYLSGDALCTGAECGVRPGTSIWSQVRSGERRYFLPKASISSPGGPAHWFVDQSRPAAARMLMNRATHDPEGVANTERTLSTPIARLV